MSEELRHASLVVLGHSKSGKSTLIGRWLVDIGALTSLEMDRLEKEGHGGAIYSKVSDKFQCERQNEMTVDMHVHSAKISKTSWTIIDVPGHRRYLKNAVSGACAADCCLLVLDATPGVFENNIKDGSIEDGVNAQIKEHLTLIYALGIKQVLVAVNKMDLCSYARQRFDFICETTMAQFKRQNLPTDEVRMIPVSSLDGDNFISPARETMHWYTGSTLCEALDALSIPKRMMDRLLRMPVQDVYRVGGIGTVICGKIESGSLSVGSMVAIAPSGIVAKVKSIERSHVTVGTANAGDMIGIGLQGIAKSDVHRGMVVMMMSNDKEMPLQVVKFTANLSVRRKFKVGYCATLCVHTAHVPCRINRIFSKLDKKTGNPLEVEPNLLNDREIGYVELIPMCPLFLDNQKEFGALGRFILQDVHQIVAFGSVKTVEMINVSCKAGSLAQEGRIAK